ncbi:pyruvate dehydrogenase (acetyl-transferring), homodimeric type [Marinomonas sp. 2405UD68-3]|uniref:pyruvate dehydrogenase (acetyl-transferring), homodimeric type n=1 Tax=Marinomonas sp. 2405UD68-3 TaxID=3391835 RepID=UPI0039C92ADD
MTEQHILEDVDPTQTKEWLDALESVLREEGPERTKFILDRLMKEATKAGTPMPASITTSYRNTISPQNEKTLPGDLFMERKIRSIIRWNALAMVMKANRIDSTLGGHITSFSSAATLYDIGFNHFFRGNTDKQDGDMVFFQGHISPGIYARSYIEGRLTDEQLDNFRREVDGKGLSSYPHPWLMPDYWQFPTVSMGLGPLQAIYQAHVMKYQHSRGLVDQGDRKVWAFLGDGECDEPESLGAIALAGREKLDNLIFVINCNLQRLDGPVRGNGKIVQELEGVFRGAGWNVIKCLWGRHWDPLFEKDHKGLLVKRMDEVCDGELQNYKANGGAYTREHFFGKYPELLEMVKDMSDDDIMNLNRGGHDPYKVYAAYAEATSHKGQPTVVLAQTVKGYGMFKAAEAQNTAHQTKKLDEESLAMFRDKFGIPITDEELKDLPYYRPAEDSPEMKYLRSRRAALGGDFPVRRRDCEALEVPSLEAFKAQLQSSKGREISSTMAFVRVLNTLVKDKKVGHRVIPIVADEARTFGMEGMFRQLGIYSAEGQKYTPHDHTQIMYYKESEKGQILQEGINEAGAMSAWLACATSYSNSHYPMIPVYIYYSMFGFQRIGDLAWAAGDSQARGFLIGATAGRTTLNGEGLQHEDGHSHIIAGTIPNCVSYDPTYSYEVAVIVQDGLRRMYQEKESVFYYLTVMNENYAHDDMPEGIEANIIKGMYKLQENTKKGNSKHVQLLGAGVILREVEAAAEMLLNDYGVDSDVFSVTSFNELRREGLDTERWNMLHPEAESRTSFVASMLNGESPVIASTDHMKLYADQIRPFVKGAYNVLGTDGFGRSDTREKLRHFFEINRYWIVVSSLKALADKGEIDASVVTQAITKFGLDPEKPNPVTC